VDPGRAIGMAAHGPDIDDGVAPLCQPSVRQIELLIH
jgi:hypothetical protein